MSDKIISLNELYEKNTLYYWCNAFGDINPPDNPMRCGELDDLPYYERDLYENYWSERFWGNLYVVSLNGDPGMLLTYLVDYGMAEDGKETDGYGALYDAATKCAEWLANSGGHPGTKVVLGKDTDPIGHELCVFVPYRLRDDIEYIAKELDESVYPFIRAEISEERER